MLARLPEPVRVAQPCRPGPRGSVIREDLCRGQYYFCTLSPGPQDTGHSVPMWHC